MEADRVLRKEIASRSRSQSGALAHGSIMAVEAGTLYLNTESPRGLERKEVYLSGVDMKNIRRWPAATELQAQHDTKRFLPSASSFRRLI